MDGKCQQYGKCQQHSDNSYSSHIASVCRACYYQLRGPLRIRKYLTPDIAVLVADAIVRSRLDYCNSLLYGISKANITKLQRVQNAFCRTVYKLNRLSHVSPYLNKLHWLPIEQRILFKYKPPSLQGNQIQPTSISLLSH